ncbi:MAG: RagB/SusD family nutrient uptake outer membrane protein [Ginsengibacter sp.]
MNTKYIKTVCWVLLAGFTLNACNKKLDIKPEGTLTEAETLRDSSNTSWLLGNTYQNLANASNGDFYTLGDITTGISTSFSNTVITGAIDPRDDNALTFWSAQYATINLANVIITKLSKYASFNTALQKQYVAEAKFIRAYSYFNLIELYGDGALEGKVDNMGVPLRLRSYDGYDSSQNIPRATNGQVWNQILKDLTEAIVDLPLSYSSDLSERTRANKTSARALAARVNLYMKNYDQCNAYCDTVLQDPNVALMPSITQVFADNSSGNTPYSFNREIIFAFPLSYNRADVLQYYSHNIYYIYGFTAPDTSFIKSHDDLDMRRSSQFIINGSTWDPFKFSDPNLLDNLVMIRVAEVMLNKSEALAYKNGVNQTSIDLLNDIHQRAYPTGQSPALYTAANFPNQQSLIDQVLQERQWELAYEGHDRFDKIRSGKKPNNVLPESRYAFPIPQNEIDITSGLIKQNPGY